MLLNHLSKAGFYYNICIEKAGWFCDAKFKLIPLEDYVFSEDFTENDMKDNDEKK